MNWIIISLIALFVISFRFLLIRYSVDKYNIDKFAYALISLAIAGLISITLLFFKPNTIQHLMTLNKEAYKFVTLIGILLIVQVTSLFYAITLI